MRRIEVMDARYFFTCRCTFLLLFLAFITEARRCKITDDCDNPGLDEFCDKTFGACMRCSGYCTGAADAMPLCLQNCPRKYWMMFRSTTTTDGGQLATTADGEEKHEQSTTPAGGERQQVQSTATVEQIQQHDSWGKKQENDYGEFGPESYFEGKKDEQVSGQATGNNVVNILVGTTCGGGVLVVAFVLGYQYRKRKGSVSLRDAENPDEVKNSTEMTNMAEANLEEITKTVAETEVTKESITTSQKETEFTAEQADAEPCKEFSQCVPSGMKDITGDENYTYLKFPKANLTETTVEELKQNTTKPVPAKLQSMGSQSLRNGCTSSFC